VGVGCAWGEAAEANGRHHSTFPAWSPASSTSFPRSVWGMAATAIRSSASSSLNLAWSASCWALVLSHVRSISAFANASRRAQSSARILVAMISSWFDAILACSSAIVALSAAVARGVFGADVGFDRLRLVQVATPTPDRHPNRVARNGVQVHRRDIHRLRCHRAGPCRSRILCLASLCTGQVGGTGRGSLGTWGPP
jgi:hypothetical protein